LLLPRSLWFSRSDHCKQDNYKILQFYKVKIPLLNLITVYSGKPGGLGSLTGAESVSFRQGSNVEFGAEAHERMVSSSLTSILTNHLIIK